MAVRTGKDITWSFNGHAFSILTAGSFKRVKAIEDGTPFGVQDQVQASAAFRSVDDLPLELFYDDDVNVDGVLQAAHLSDVSAALVATWTSGKTSTVQAFVKMYERLPKVGALSRCRATFSFTGAVSEA